MPLNLCTCCLEENQTHRNHGSYRYGARRGEERGEQKHFAKNQPGLLYQEPGGAATPRILELSPEAPGPAHWALWLLRTRTAPGTRGEGRGRDRTGANTDGKYSICGAASWKQLGGPAPHQPCRPQVHLTLESSDEGLRYKGLRCGVKGELWTEGDKRTSDGRTMCESKWDGSRKGLCFLQSGQPPGLSSSFWDAFSLPLAPESGPVPVLAPSRLLVQHGFSAFSTPTVFPLSYRGWGDGEGGRRRGQAVPRKPTGPPVLKESLKIGPARRVPAGDLQTVHVHK